MNIRKRTLVVEKSTREILCNSLISKFKHISIKLFFICCNRKKERKKKSRIFKQKRHIKGYTLIYYLIHKFR
jgi:hypothetical protein